MDRNQLTEGMTRQPDHRTSIAAAEHVSKRKPTIREQVIEFYLKHPNGATDDMLRCSFPHAPESSYRKRRTELTQDNILLPTHAEDKNTNDQWARVFIHRDFVRNPPPIKPRAQAPSRFAQLQEENARLKAIVTVDHARRRAAADAVSRSYEQECRETGSFTTGAMVDAVIGALGLEKTW